jgi:putative transposase
MHDLVILFIHLITTAARLAGRGGVRSVLAESILVGHQLLILNRSRQRAPHLRLSDRLVAGCCALLVRSSRLIRSAIVLKPSTLLSLHQTLRNRKYRRLFSSERKGRPGPKGPNQELIEAVVQMKQRNPTWGCPRIAQQIALAFDVPIDKDRVRRILARHYRGGQDSGGPSWLTFLGHLKDSLWSVDLFRCESATLRTHWVLVVMDQYTRRIIGFGLHAGAVDGSALCRMFNRALRGQREVPKYLSSDHDPLYWFGQWQANPRILEVTEIKTLPSVPWSHPFVERLIGTIRREYLDHTLFWTTANLERDVLQRLTTGQGSVRMATEAVSSSGEAERAIDKPVLQSDGTLGHPPNLALPNLVHRFVTLNRPPRTTELPKMLLGTDPLLDGAVILLQNVVQILNRPMAAALS